ncbi:hypothetical protein [Nocardia carnea]|uniref:hypothetical protein n=1 Tax=Nocardia carnea TaxID=37328 RepID=UPI002454848C|nr:hypothetical protein [Nocardia carnea]
MKIAAALLLAGAISFTCPAFAQATEADIGVFPTINECNAAAQRLGIPYGEYNCNKLPDGSWLLRRGTLHP